MMDEIEQIAPIVHRKLPRGIHIETAAAESHAAKSQVDARQQNVIEASVPARLSPR